MSRTPTWKILRQKQVYALPRDIATENQSRVVMVTHSEVLLDEALDHNLTLLLEGRADDIATRTDIRNALKHSGAEHCVRARQRGYLLYVEGGADLDVLRALANRPAHPATRVWDERINAVQETRIKLAPTRSWSNSFRNGSSAAASKTFRHQLVTFADPATIPPEVGAKLDLLKALFESARPNEGESG